MRMRVISLIAGLAALFGTQRLAGDLIVEVGDQTDSIPTNAYSTYGDGGSTILQIKGSIASANDADMFPIWITDPVNFSAATAGSALYDAQLFLFDAGGRGVYANDDVQNHGGGGYDPSAHLTAANAFSPTAAGLYFLAISSWDLDPHSAGGAIFNDDAHYDWIVGPVAAGGASPVTGWDGPGGLNGAIGAYQITLTGANTVSSVPELGTSAITVAGVLVYLATRRRAT